MAKLKEKIREDLQRVRDEWEGRLQEEQLKCQKTVVELQAKHGLQI